MLNHCLQCFGTIAFAPIWLRYPVAHAWFVGQSIRQSAVARRAVADSSDWIIVIFFQSNSSCSRIIEDVLDYLKALFYGFMWRPTSHLAYNRVGCMEIKCFCVILSSFTKHQSFEVMLGAINIFSRHTRFTPSIPLKVVGTISISS